MKKKILHISWFDCAGIVSKFCDAFDIYSDKYEMRSIIYQSSVLKYPHDIWIPVTPLEEQKKAIDEADIIIFHPFINGGEYVGHLMNDWETFQYKNFNYWKYIKEQKKPVIWFLNGSNNLRCHATHYQKKLMNKFLMCSTPDLKLLFPWAFFSPAFINLDDELNKPLPMEKRNKKTRIVHFPTDPRIKNTNDFISMIDLIGKKYDYDFNVISQISNRSALAYKRASHINLDHLQGYYGVSSLESAAQGLINIVHLQDKQKKIFLDVAGTDATPFAEVKNIQEATQKIVYLLQHPEEINELSFVARSWMETYWHPKKHVARMEAYFDEVWNRK